MITPNISNEVYSRDDGVVHCAATMTQLSWQTARYGIALGSAVMVLVATMGSPFGPLCMTRLSDTECLTVSYSLVFDSDVIENTHWGMVDIECDKLDTSGTSCTNLKHRCSAGRALNTLMQAGAITYGFSTIAAPTPEPRSAIAIAQSIGAAALATSLVGIVATHAGEDCTVTMNNANASSFINTLLNTVPTTGQETTVEPVPVTTTTTATTTTTQTDTPVNMLTATRIMREPHCLYGCKVLNYGCLLDLYARKEQDAFPTSQCPSYKDLDVSDMPNMFTFGVTTTDFKPVCALGTHDVYAAYIATMVSVNKVARTLESFCTECDTNDPFYDTNNCVQFEPTTSTVTTATATTITTTRSTITTSTVTATTVTTTTTTRSTITTTTTMPASLQANNAEEIKTYLRNFLAAPPTVTRSQLEKMDVSTVTNFNQLFMGLELDINLNQWDFTNAETMDAMFEGNGVFNNGGKPIEWSLPKVTSVNRMFGNALGINVPVTITSPNLIDAQNMFETAKEFNHEVTISSDQHVDARGMFRSAEQFQGPFNPVFTFKSAANMFYRALVFDQNINHWNLSSTTAPHVASMFKFAFHFGNKCEQVEWNLANAVQAFDDKEEYHVNGMFLKNPDNTQKRMQNSLARAIACSNKHHLGARSAEELYAEFGGLDVLDCTKLSDPEEEPETEQLVAHNKDKIKDYFLIYLGGYCPPSVTKTQLEQMDVSAVDDFSGLFSANNDVVARNININLNAWEFSSATLMTSMCEGSQFNNGGVPIDWTLPKVTSVSRMFYNAKRLDVDVTITSPQLQTATSMFESAAAFKKSVTIMSDVEVDATKMFRGAQLFQGPFIPQFTFKAAAYMFSDATSFDQDINEWKLASTSAPHLDEMFKGASAFANKQTPLDCDLENAVKAFDDSEQDHINDMFANKNNAGSLAKDVACANKQHVFIRNTQALYEVLGGTGSVTCGVPTVETTTGEPQADDTSDDPCTSKVTLDPGTELDFYDEDNLYKNGQVCEWLLQCENGRVPAFTFTKIATEENWDRVLLLDGENPDSAIDDYSDSQGKHVLKDIRSDLQSVIIERVDGRANGGDPERLIAEDEEALGSPIYATESSMTIRFLSDREEGQHKGFYGTWECVDPRRARRDEDQGCIDPTSPCTVPTRNCLLDRVQQYNTDATYNDPQCQIEDWDVSGIEDFNSVFANSVFNRDLSNWNVSSMKNAVYMFRGNTHFNSPLFTFPASTSNLGHMFEMALAFNQPIRGLVTTGFASKMFSGATLFNQPLDFAVTNDATQLFDGAAAMTADISNMSFTTNNRLYMISLDNTAYETAQKRDFVCKWFGGKEDYDYAFHLNGFVAEDCKPVEQVRAAVSVSTPQDNTAHESMSMCSHDTVVTISTDNTNTHSLYSSFEYDLHDFNVTVERGSVSASAALDLGTVKDKADSSFKVCFTSDYVDGLSFPSWITSIHTYDRVSVWSTLLKLLMSHDPFMCMGKDTYTEWAAKVSYEVPSNDAFAAAGVTKATVDEFVTYASTLEGGAFCEDPTIAMISDRASTLVIDDPNLEAVWRRMYGMGRYNNNDAKLSYNHVGDAQTKWSAINNTMYNGNQLQFLVDVYNDGRQENNGDRRDVSLDNDGDEIDWQKLASNSLSYDAYAWDLPLNMLYQPLIRPTAPATEPAITLSHDPIDAYWADKLQTNGIEPLYVGAQGARCGPHASCDTETNLTFGFLQRDVAVIGNVAKALLQTRPGCGAEFKTDSLTHLTRRLVSKVGAPNCASKNTLEETMRINQSHWPSWVDSSLYVFGSNHALPRELLYPGTVAPDGTLSSAQKNLLQVDADDTTIGTYSLLRIRPHPRNEYKWVSPLSAFGPNPKESLYASSNQLVQLTFVGHDKDCEKSNAGIAVTLTSDELHIKVGALDAIKQINTFSVFFDIDSGYCTSNVYVQFQDFIAAKTVVVESDCNNDVENTCTETTRFDVDLQHATYLDSSSAAEQMKATYWANPHLEWVRSWRTDDCNQKFRRVHVPVAMSMVYVNDIATKRTGSLVTPAIPVYDVYDEKRNVYITKLPDGGHFCRDVDRDMHEVVIWPVEPEHDYVFVYDVLEQFLLPRASACYNERPLNAKNKDDPWLLSAKRSNNERRPCNQYRIVCVPATTNWDETQATLFDRTRQEVVMPTLAVPYQLSARVTLTTSTATTTTTTTTKVIVSTVQKSIHPNAGCSTVYPDDNNPATQPSVSVLSGECTTYLRALGDLTSPSKEKITCNADNTQYTYTFWLGSGSNPGSCVAEAGVTKGPFTSGECVNIYSRHMKITCTSDPPEPEKSHHWDSDEQCAKTYDIAAEIKDPTCKNANSGICADETTMTHCPNSCGCCFSDKDGFLDSGVSEKCDKLKTGPALRRRRSTELEYDAFVHFDSSYGTQAVTRERSSYGSQWITNDGRPAFPDFPSRYGTYSKVYTYDTPVDTDKTRYAPLVLKYVNAPAVKSGGRSRQDVYNAVGSCSTMYWTLPDFNILDTCAMLADKSKAAPAVYPAATSVFCGSSESITVTVSAGGVGPVARNHDYSVTQDINTPVLEYYKLDGTGPMFTQGVISNLDTGAYGLTWPTVPFQHMQPLVTQVIESQRHIYPLVSNSKSGCDSSTQWFYTRVQGAAKHAYNLAFYFNMYVIGPDYDETCPSVDYHGKRVKEAFTKYKNTSSLTDAIAAGTEVNGIEILQSVGSDSNNNWQRVPSNLGTNAFPSDVYQVIRPDALTDYYKLFMPAPDTLAYASTTSGYKLDLGNAKFRMSTTTTTTTRTTETSTVSSATSHTTTTTTHTTTTSTVSSVTLTKGPCYVADRTALDFRIDALEANTYSSNFSGCEFENLDVSAVKEFGAKVAEDGLFSNTPANPNINNWDFQRMDITGLKYAFSGSNNFNNGDKAINWILPTAPIDIDGMFEKNKGITVPITLTGPTKIYAYFAFDEATNFVGPLTLPEQVKIMAAQSMFARTTRFNQNINAWDFSECETFADMLFKAENFTNGGQTPNWMFTGVNEQEQLAFLWKDSGLSPLQRGELLCLNQAKLEDINSDLDWNTQLGGGASKPTGCDWQADWWVQPPGNQSIINATAQGPCFVANRAALDDRVAALEADTYNTTFPGCAFENLDVSAVSHFSNYHNGAFYKTTANPNLNNWLFDSLDGTGFYFTFALSDNFNNGGKPIEWDLPVAPVLNANNMFYKSKGISVPITLNGPTKVLAAQAFQEASNFVGPLALPAGVQITLAQKMFKSATSFNQDLNVWDFSHCTSFISMLELATSFTNEGKDPDWKFTSVSNANGLKDLWKESGLSALQRGALLCANKVKLEELALGLDWNNQLGGGAHKPIGCDWDATWWDGVASSTQASTTKASDDAVDFDARCAEAQGSGEDGDCFDLLGADDACTTAAVKFKCPFSCDCCTITPPSASNNRCEPITDRRTRRGAAFAEPAEPTVQSAADLEWLPVFLLAFAAALLVLDVVVLCSKQGNWVYRRVIGRSMYDTVGTWTM